MKGVVNMYCDVCHKSPDSGLQNLNIYYDTPAPKLDIEVCRKCFDRIVTFIKVMQYKYEKKQVLCEDCIRVKETK